jgi:hypothetical protein
MPPGCYEIETEEELLMDVSFPAYRRLATYIFLPAQGQGRFSAQMSKIDPLELATAEEIDARRAVDRAGS